MQKITPFLWFNDNAEEAMNFYVSIFKNSKVGTVSRYGAAGPGPKGTVDPRWYASETARARESAASLSG